MAKAEGRARAYVSRGGEKLAAALKASGLPVAGRRALDVGASTGGFTDCLLRSGAEAVVAVDVGYGQLAWRLRTDPRVYVLERCNARYLEVAQLPFSPELAVVDVSFISLTKVLPAVIACLTATHDLLALIKPQFELGPGRVGKGGVVRKGRDRREALEAVANAAVGLGEGVVGYYPSPLSGPKGNRETFIWLCEGGRPGVLREASALAQLAAAAEPEDG